MAESFERAALSLPYEEEFRDVEIVSHRVHRHGRAHDLTLVVDRTSGVDVALCERIGARLNELLETEDDPYSLAVESPGLDRPLLRPADYDRFRDRDVCVQTTLPMAASTHRGKLLGVRGNAAILATPKGELPIPLEMIKSANLEFDYRAALRRDETRETRRPMKATKTAPDEPTLRESLRALQGERAIPFEMLLEALEAALLSAYKRNFGAEANAIVAVDRDTGEYKVYHRRLVVDEVTDPKLEVTRKEAGAKYEPGDYYDEEVTPKQFGRIAAQTAKQVIVQRIREAERDTIFNEYSQQTARHRDGHRPAVRAAQHVRRSR